MNLCNFPSESNWQLFEIAPLIGVSPRNGSRSRERTSNPPPPPLLFFFLQTLFLLVCGSREARICLWNLFLNESRSNKIEFPRLQFRSFSLPLDTRPHWPLFLFFSLPVSLSFTCTFFAFTHTQAHIWRLVCLGNSLVSLITEISSENDIYRKFSTRIFNLHFFLALWTSCIGPIYSRYSPLHPESSSSTLQ